MFFSQALSIVSPGTSVSHRTIHNKIKTGSFTVLEKDSNTMRVRNSKGNERRVTEKDWDTFVAALPGLRDGSIARNSLKNMQTTYVMGLIGLWEDQGKRFY